jgi:hypothetical protein
MPDTKLIQSLPQIPSPVLTAYLETNPTDSRNQRKPPGYLIWLKSQAKNLEEEVPQGERKIFHQQVERLREYLLENPPHARGVVIFAGPAVWQSIFLRVDTKDELFWGLPSLTQWLWTLEEHRACGVVLADRAGARFFQYWMGELTEEHGEHVKINTAEWRRMDLMPPSQPGTEVIRGSHRDAFDRRMEGQYVRFYAKEAEHIRAWADRKNLNPVFMAGPPKLLELAWAELPKGTQARTVLIQEDLEHLPVAEFQARIETELQRWEREYERALIDNLLDGSSGAGAVLGVDETLVGLQEGLLRDVVVARGLEIQVSQCTKCGWIDRISEPVCPACGGARRMTDLRAVLPPLAKRYKVPLEVIAEDVGERLRKAGGIGGWLK